MRHLTVVVVLLVALVAIAPQRTERVTARDTEDDLREAVATAEEIFQLAADRKFNAMYDRIHPDAHAVVPRAAAVGTFEEIYAQVRAGRAEITDDQITEWTW